MGLFTRNRRKVKYNLALPVEVDNLLTTLAYNEGTTKGEVIRRSLALFSYIKEHINSGKQLLLCENIQTIDDHQYVIDENAIEIVFDDITKEKT